MNYIELINSFWLKDKEFNFSDRETALYFYLLSISNSIGWKNPFGLSNALTIAKFGWGKSSFDTAKNRLKLAGLIDFKAGDGRGIVYQYEIKVIKKVGQIIPLSVALSDHLSDTLSDQKPDTSINKKDKLKQKSSLGAKAPVKKIFTPPALLQVEEYVFGVMGNAKKSRPWPEDKCRNMGGRIFDHYTANGWVQGKGKKIVDWQAACRTFIRNELDGTYKNVKSDPEVKTNNNQERKAEGPTLNKVQQELNIMYEIYLEDNEKCTIRSIETYHYDQLKEDQMAKFPDGHTEQIEKKAIEFNPEAANNPDLKVKLMKCFSVLTLFDRFKKQLKTAVYVLS